jgi:Prophage tail length tape measure protein
MSAGIGDLVANLALNSAAFGAGLKTAQSSMTGFVGKMLAVAAPLGAAFGFEHALSAAGEQIRAEKKLDSVLRSTGNAAGLSSQELKSFASELQKTTNYSDQQTIAAESVLATFTNIKGTTFKEAIKSAQDMNTIMGGDLQSNVIQLGKALNDPIKGVNALRRVGVSFTQQQMAQIKAMQQSGNVAGAQAIVLKELQTEFGGAAGALASPMKQAGNMVNDLAENFGMVLGPVLKEGAKAFMEMIGPIADSRESFQALGQQLAAIGTVIGQLLGSFLVPLGSALAQTGKLLVGMWMGGSVSATDFGNVGMLAADKVTLGVMKIFPSSEKVFESVGVIGAATWEFIATAASEMWDNLKTLFFSLVDIVKAAGSAIGAAIAAALNFENPITAAEEALTEGMKKVKQDWGGGLKDVLSDSTKAFHDTLDNATQGLQEQGGLAKVLTVDKDKLQKNVDDALKGLPQIQIAKGKDFKFPNSGGTGGAVSDKQKHQEKLTSEMRGSKEDLSSIVEAITGRNKDHQATIANNTKTLADNSQKTNELLEDLADIVGDEEVYDLIGG